MRRVNRIGFLAALLISSAVQSQQSPTTASIEGIVVRADNGEPVAGAQVMLNPARLELAAAGAGAPTVVNALPTLVTQAGNGGFVASPTGGFVSAGNVQPVTTNFQPATTGMDGKFSFKDLAAGPYRLSATANAFVRQEYGQRTPTGQGRVLFVTAGQTVKDANIRLISTGVVTGRVFDETGQPATGAPVQLIRPVYTAITRNFQTVGSGTADDRGDFRIFAVPPGRYYLVAGTQPGPGGVRGGGVAGGRFSMVFFPNSSELEQASTIEVKSGAEASFDLRTQRQVQTFRVRGRIVNPSGTPLPANVPVMLSYRTFNASGSFGGGRNVDPATGNFELQNVAPGEYAVTIQIPEPNPVPLGGPLDLATVAARQAAQASRPSAQVPVRVVNADVEGVVLTLAAGYTATGRIVVEGQAPRSVANLDRIRLMFIRPAIPFGNQTLPAASPAAADGTFQVSGLREGEYRLQIPFGTLPPGSYVKSIQFGGDDVLTKPLRLSDSSTGSFEVTLRAGTAQISGSVVDARSQPVPGIQVVMIPNQRGRFDLFRPATTDQSGRFSLANVPPGDYKLFSWEANDSGAFYDPEFLKQYEQQGKTVLVTESSNQNVEVKMIPAQ